MKRDIIFYSSIRWDYAWHRQQELAVKLAARGCRILFLQPPVKTAPLRQEWSQPQENIWCCTPPGLPYERLFYGIHRFNAVRARRTALEKAGQLSFARPLLWTDRPHGFDLPYYTAHGFDIVYDLVDDTLAFGRVRNAALLISLEDRLLKEASLVLSSSQTLLDRKLAQSKRTGTCHFLPNGVDLSRFPENDTLVTPPAIGFAGTIAPWRIDYDLVRTCAALRPDWTFLFVGPGTSQDKQKLMQGLPNLHVEDAVPGRDIPALLARFSVGWIPYRTDTASMDYVFPRKALEYLAAGKPVVSTPLPEVLALQASVGDVLRTADTPEDALAALEKALRSAKPAACRAAAIPFDWDALLKALPE